VATRLRRLGIVLAVLGLVFALGSAYAFIRVQEGYRSLNAFSAAQNVTLSYNEEGQLVDRGEVEGAQAIMALLTDEWGYPVQAGELNPNDPVVTAADGTVYKAGVEYQVPVDGRYWAAFDRSNPIDAAVRAQAWTGVAHALIGELGVGTVTASTLQMGLGMAGLFAGVGLSFIIAGLGLVWAARPEKVKVPALQPVATPA
jgi:hypothetical protein